VQVNGLGRISGKCEGRGFKNLATANGPRVERAQVATIQDKVQAVTEHVHRSELRLTAASGFQILGGCAAACGVFIGTVATTSFRQDFGAQPHIRWSE